MDYPAINVLWSVLQKATSKLISTHVKKRKLALYAYLRKLLKIYRLAFASNPTIDVCITAAMCPLVGNGRTKRTRKFLVIF